MENRRRQFSRGRVRMGVRASCCMLLLGLAVGSTPWASADEATDQWASAPAHVLSEPRDPIGFLQELDLVLPRPVVVLNQQDAVAQELLRYSRTMSEIDALRTAQAICEAAEELKWDPLLFLAVIHVESYYDHLAVSPVGAEGLMQLMPPTAKWMADRLHVEWPDYHSFDPVLNVQLGTHYLAHLQREFSRLDQILTAYNRGPRATRYILNRHGTLPKDVRDFYATLVLKRYAVLHHRYGHLPAA